MGSVPSATFLGESGLAALREHVVKALTNAAQAYLSLEAAGAPAGAAPSPAMALALGRLGLPPGASGEPLRRARLTMVVKHASDALGIDPANGAGCRDKALFRRGAALLALGRPELAVEDLRRLSDADAPAQAKLREARAAVKRAAEKERKVWGAAFGGGAEGGGSPGAGATGAPPSPPASPSPAGDSGSRRAASGEAPPSSPPARRPTAPPGASPAGASPAASPRAGDSEAEAPAGEAPGGSHRRSFVGRTPGPKSALGASLTSALAPESPAAAAAAAPAAAAAEGSPGRPGRAAGGSAGSSPRKERRVLSRTAEMPPQEEAGALTTYMAIGAAALGVAAIGTMLWMRRR